MSRSNLKYSTTAHYIILWEWTLYQSDMYYRASKWSRQSLIRYQIKFQISKFFQIYFIGWEFWCLVYNFRVFRSLCDWSQGSLLVMGENPGRVLLFSCFWKGGIVLMLLLGWFCCLVLDNNIMESGLHLLLLWWDIFTWGL